MYLATIRTKRNFIRAKLYYVREKARLRKYIVFLQWNSYSLSTDKIEPVHQGRQQVHTDLELLLPH
jgi:hypothetical protein